MQAALKSEFKKVFEERLERLERMAKRSDLNAKEGWFIWNAIQSTRKDLEALG